MHQGLCRTTLSRPRRTRENYLRGFGSQVTRTIERVSAFAALPSNAPLTGIDMTNQEQKTHVKYKYYDI
jgi:hypothetical protein